MSIAWHRTEPREVRPFFETAKAENALDDSGIRLFASADTSQDTAFDLDEIDFQKLEPVVHLVMADALTWMPEGLSVDDFEIVLIARNSFLKRSEIVGNYPLSAELPPYIPVDADLLGRLGGGRNLLLALALCLSTDRDPVPGTPFVPGHWLAKKTFFFRTRTLPQLFDLQMRTDEGWVAAGFPAKTFYAVEYAGGISGEMEDGSSVATVHIHIDAHNKMINSPVGESLQAVLSAEIITSIVVDSLVEWQDLETVDPASPLATLTKQLGGAEPMTVDELKKLCARPSKLRAILQDRLSVVRAI